METARGIEETLEAISNDKAEFQALIAVAVTRDGFRFFHSRLSVNDLNALAVITNKMAQDMMEEV